MAAKTEIVDARGGENVLTDGTKLRNLLRGRIKSYQEQYDQLLNRMNNELPTKEAAVTLMIALEVNDSTVNAQVLFFQACIAKAAWLDKEIRQLTTIGQALQDGVAYMITIQDAARYGL